MILKLVDILLPTPSTVMDLCLDLMENMNWIQTIILVVGPLNSIVLFIMDCQCLAPVRTIAEEVK